MKQYQIIKNQDLYGVANKEDIKAYNKSHLLPVVLFMKTKKDLIYIIENNAYYNDLKNNTNYKTIIIY